MNAQDLERIRADIASRNVELQRNALIEIRKLRTAEASRLAVPLLQSRDEILRASAANAVIYLPPAEAASVLLPLLNDKAEFVRQEAAYALGDVGDASATSALIRLVQKDKDPVRNAAIVSLGKIGDSYAIDVLHGVFKSKPNEDNEFARRSAAKSIGQIAESMRGKKDTSPTPQSFLPSKFKEDPPKNDLSIATLQFQAAGATLRTVLQNEKEADDTRREAAYALGTFDQGSSIPVLQKYLNSTDRHLAEICKEALIKLGVAQ